MVPGVGHSSRREHKQISVTTSPKMAARNWYEPIPHAANRYCGGTRRSCTRVLQLAACTAVLVPATAMESRS
eukprot:869266-Rhodomonas_salina.1